MTWCEICHGATGTTCTCPTEAPFDVATGEAPAASPEISTGEKNRLNVSTASLQTISLPDPDEPVIPLVVSNLSSEEIFRITPDRRLVFADGVEPKEAARVFADWVNERLLPTPNSEAESALLEALERIIAEVSERRVGHREKIAEIARTAIDQAKSSTEEVP